MPTNLVLPEYLVTIYDYNYWANQRMLDVAAALNHEQLFRQQGHSWGCVQGVLAHIRNAEWIWLRRWHGESPKALPGVEQFPDVAALRQDWAVLERQMRDFVAAQTRQSLQQKITYTNTSGQVYTLELWKMMVH